MNFFVLIGIAIIIVGFIFKLDVVAVVLISGLVTGLIAKIGIVEVLNAIGTGFVNNRYMSLFFISFPVIAIMERYGLKLRAAEFRRNCTARRSHPWCYCILPRHGTFYDDYGERICSLYRYYHRRRYSLCHRAGRKSCGCRFTRYDVRILRYPVNADGSKLQ